MADEAVRTAPNTRISDPCGWAVSVNVDRTRLIFGPILGFERFDRSELRQLAFSAETAAACGVEDRTFAADRFGAHFARAL